jgi:hypothetical protein
MNRIGVIGREELGSDKQDVITVLSRSISIACVENIGISTGSGSPKSDCNVPFDLIRFEFLVLRKSPGRKVSVSLYTLDVTAIEGYRLVLCKLGLWRSPRLESVYSVIPLV